MAEPGNTQGAEALLDDAAPRDRRCETPGVLNDVRKYPTTVGGKAFGVNVYAVIVEAKPATRSKSGDFYCSFKIMDPSLIDVEEFPLGMDARVFSSDVRKIPPTQNDGGSISNWIDRSLQGREIQLGDILRLHRCWFEKNTVVAQLDNGGSLCLFTSNSNDLAQPYWSSHPNVDRRAEGDSIISRLRQFSEVVMERINARNAQGILGAPFDRRFDELTNRMFCDLFVKVLRIDKQADGSNLLWIWDGTDVKPQKFKADNPNTVDADSQASEFRQLGDESVHRPLVPKLSALKDFPDFGTIMPMTFSDKVEQLDPAPYNNKWVKLRNVIVHSINGQLQAFFHSKSSISALHDASRQSRTRNLMERMRLTSEAWPSTHFCTGSLPAAQTFRKHLPVVPLRKVLQETFRRGRMDQAIASYRCKVRVLASDPVGDFCRQGSSRSDWVFGVLLHLEDATGDLVAALHGPRAEAFFGMQAFDVSDAANSHARLKLEYAHSKLMDPSCWLECCLRVIWENLSEKPIFFIGDTKMNLDNFQARSENVDDGGLGETGQNAARDGVGRESVRNRRNTSAGEDAAREHARKRRNTTSV
ncbi:hypothetical protein BSKO_02348 [Bryopsis sp. KO-2023]|nr:hypothetical protein BSKO_02348 [Bryopsis sp. KO-2023]